MIFVRFIVVSFRKKYSRFLNELPLHLILRREGKQQVSYVFRHVIVLAKRQVSYAFRHVICWQTACVLRVSPYHAGNIPGRWFRLGSGSMGGAPGHFGWREFGLIFHLKESLAQSRGCQKPTDGEGNSDDGNGSGSQSQKMFAGQYKKNET